jgi:hypothetical protein
LTLLGATLCIEHIGMQPAGHTARTAPAFGINFGDGIGDDPGVRLFFFAEGARLLFTRAAELGFSVEGGRW